MELNKKLRRQLRLQGFTFAALFLAAVGLVAWISTQYHYEADWTSTGRHTLTAASVDVLKRFKGPVTVTAFVRDADPQVSRRGISEFIERYQRHKPDLVLDFVNPDLHPDKVRESNIQVEGEMVLAYEGRRENVQALREEELSNALQRLVRGGERHLLSLQGHGERKLDGEANHDLGIWGGQLTTKGFVLGKVDLRESAQIATEDAVLVIASPDTNLLPGEVQAVRDFAARGGNLLWLADPGDLHGLKPLAEDLGIQFHPGVIVDPTTQALGIENPAFALAGSYPAHPTTEGFAKITLFPLASAIGTNPSAGWQPAPLILTDPRAYAESDREIRFDEGKDLPGPLALGVSLSRKLEGSDNAPGRTQRVVVVGDGDFLSNSFLGNAGNQELGNRIVNWLSHDDEMVTIPPRAAPDVRLEMTRTLYIVIGFAFLLVVPGVLLATGIYIWMKRRKR